MEKYISIGVLLLIVFVGLPVLSKLLNKLIGQSELKLPYHTKYILTKPEYRFYLALKPIMDAKSYLICPKVGLKDMFEVNAGTKDRQAYFRKIAQKHIDFLICDSNLRPLFAIELDDKSHNREEVKEKDKFKDSLFNSAGLPLYRVPTASSYSEEYLRKYIKIGSAQE